jgi:hypothetical protein
MIAFYIATFFAGMSDHEWRRLEALASIATPKFTLGYTRAGYTRLRRMPSTEKESNMDKDRQK